MEQEKLDIRNKTGDELIDLYDEIAHDTLNDVKDFQTIYAEEYFEEELNTCISLSEFK